MQVKKTVLLGQYIVIIEGIKTPTENESAYGNLVASLKKKRNTILITGSCKTIHDKTVYNVIIWGSEAGESIQFITQREIVTKTGYAELWETAKGIAVAYFDNNKFQDGGYTVFHDHITMIHQPAQ